MEKAGRLLKRNILFYFFGVAVIFGLKLFYSRAGSDELRWILAPTVRWVELLSGISFEYEPGAGYVNHSLRYLIAPSCAGVNFMIIMISALLFPFVHRIEMPQKKSAAAPEENPQGKFREEQLSGFWRKICWTACSLPLSYLTTVLVNGLRIIAAVYLPDFFRRTGILNGQLSEGRLHTAIGVMVYFVCLLTVYRLADRFVCRLAGSEAIMPQAEICPKRASETSKCLLIPAFWYFCITLGLPFISRACHGETEGYGEYALLVALTGGSVLAAYGLGRLVRRIIR